MNICLINPPASTEESSWDLSALDGFTPPMGLLTIASIIRTHGHTINIIDAPPFRLSIQEIAKKAVSLNPDIVGLTSATPMIGAAASIANEIKDFSSKIKVIIGGPHITAIPLETFKKFPYFDIGIIGEGDNTIVELLNALEKDADLASINGIIYRSGSNIIKTPPRTGFVDLNLLPLPAWDLVDSFPQKYHLSIITSKSYRSTGIITSRGCPGSCQFCDSSVFGKKFRGFSAERVINEIKFLIGNYGIKDFEINDDNFVVDRARLKKICLAIIEQKLNISWSCGARIDMVDPETLDLMKLANRVRDRKRKRENFKNHAKTN